MKKRIFVICPLFFTFCLTARATPDREIEITERILGTSHTGFIILRQETDNMGNYYSSKVTHYLDVYKKTPNDPEVDDSIAKKESSTLLSSQITTIDIESNGPPTTRENEPSNKSILLADLVKEHPMYPSRWNDEKFNRLKAHSTAGIHLDRLDVVWGGRIKERLGYDRNADVEWKLTEVFEDSNSLFLKISSEDQERWVCILPPKTQQANAHLQRKDFYLLAGVYTVQADAFQEAKRLADICKSKNHFGFEPEIWSEDHGLSTPRFIVVHPLEKHSFSVDAFSKLEKILDKDIGVVSSDRFNQRFFAK